MASLNISDSAYALVKRELERSDIVDPVVELYESMPSYPLPDEILRLPRDIRDRALEDYRAALRGVPHELRPGARPRSEVSAENLLRIRDVWFVFSPEWQNRMNGWLLDSLGEDLVLFDEKRNVILPLQAR